MSKYAVRNRKIEPGVACEKLCISTPPCFSWAQSRLIDHALACSSLVDVLTEAAKLAELLAPAAVGVAALVPERFGERCQSERLAGGPLAGAFGLGATPPSLLDRVRASGKTIAVDSFVHDSEWAEHGLRAIAAGYHSALGLALHVPGEEAPIGALALYFQEGRGINAALHPKLESYAAVVAQLPGMMAAREGSRFSHERMAQIASAIPGVVYQRIVRPDGEIRYSYISEGAKELFGVEAQAILRDPQVLFDRYCADYRQSFREKLMEASHKLSVWDVEARIERPDGSIRYTHAIAHPRRLEDGSVLWTGVILDATRMKLAEIAAAEAEVKTRDAIVESFSQGLLLFGPDGRLVVSNSKFHALNPGLAAVAIPGAAYVDVLKAELDAKRSDNIIESDAAFEFCERLSRHRRCVGSVFERQIVGDRWVLINDSPTETGGKVVLYTDVTEIKRRERYIEHVAHHDALTGLPNRIFFRKKLEEALGRAMVESSGVAVVFVDLDRFKAVNDTLGHLFGDALLKVVAGRIRECLSPGDVAARLGGDEFALVITQNTSVQALTALARRLIDLLSRPVMIDGHSVIVGASLGIASSQGGVSSADELLKQADLALYRAKSDGRSAFRLFEHEMDAVAQQRRALEMDLRMAMKLDQFQVYYQPLVDVFTAQMVGAEALLRWTHPSRGKISPAEFIPLAEETGLISEIGLWVLRRACEDAVRWPLATRIAVNCSPAQFLHGNFVDRVREVLETSGLKPSLLEVEITESLLLRDTDKNLDTLWGLKRLGVRISMDDFGTGYSSLGNLRSFPFDKIKIDRSFIADLKHSVDAAAIIRAVVSLGRSLGITTTAEGVETRDQLTYLRAEGCLEVQGHYYSEARPAEDIHAILINSPNGVLQPRGAAGGGRGAAP